MDRLGQHKKVEFILDSVEQGSKELKIDPVNWNSDDKSYQLDLDSRGVLLKINTNLEFIKDGYDYLRGSTLAFGLNPEISVTKWGKDAKSKHEDWRILYQSYLDMPKIKFDLKRKIAKVPFTQGGLYDRIKARFSDKFDLVSTKDANGNDISELKTIIEQVTGREIFRESTAIVEDGVSVNHPVSGGDKDVARAVVFTVNPNSDSDFIYNVTIGTEAVPYNNGDYASGLVSSLLFPRSDRKRTRTLNGKIKVKLDPLKVHDGSLRLEKVFYQYNTSNNKYEYISGSRDPLVIIDTSISGNILEHDFVSDKITLEKDMACALVLYSNTDDGIGYEYESTKVVITEDEYYEPTVAKNLLPFELVERFLEKITGESGLLISNVLGRKDLGYAEDGEWSLLGTSSGFWARGFGLNSNPEKQFTISLKDVLKSIHAIFPIMWSIEKRNGKEYFRLEKYEYTFQPYTGIQLGRTTSSGFQYISANDPEISTLSKNLYTGVQMGFEKGGNDYEEISGLSSPHGTCQYSTSLDSKEANIYSKLSKIRGDVEGYDLARRKQAQFYQDEDTPYDQDIFFRHLKRIGNQYFSRTWQDDFSQAPQGENVYSPNTMGNLLIMPFYCVLRHGRIINTGLYKDPFANLTFISSNCFSEFSTTRIGEVEIFENGSVINQYLGTPFTSEFKLSFKGKVYQEMIDQIEGFTKVNGEYIPNWYGIFETVVDGALYRGKMIKTEIQGNHEIALIP